MRTLWAFIALILTCAGCAKMADPKPSVIPLIMPANDLSAHQQSDYIVLSASRPIHNVDGTEASSLKSIDVFRLEEGASAANTNKPLPESEFTKQAVRIMSIPSSRLPEYFKGNLFVIADKSLSQDATALYSHAYRYAVLFINKKNRAAGLSNQAHIKPAPIPGPPSGIAAEVTENAIKLTWNPPLENIDGSKPPRIVGYNLFKSEKPDEFPSTPLNASPIKKPEFEDVDFRFDATYYYSVSTIGSVGDPDAESLRSESIKTLAKDVFPPAPPENFSALVEGDDVILVWTPSPAKDVAGYVLYRKEIGVGDRIRLNKELVTRQSYRDQAVAGKRYEYWIQAVDARGNESLAIRTESESR
jgi:hypothetical protein